MLHQWESGIQKFVFTIYVDNINWLTRKEPVQKLTFRALGSECSSEGL